MIREALFILLLRALLIIPLYSTAQDKSAIDFLHRFNTYRDALFAEKIYLHLDKPYYAAGEYMYFRAYLTDMQSDQVSVGSRIIYVELSDGKKEIIRRVLLYAEESGFAGQLLLPDSLPSANYHLRAYTNRMRNAGEDYFYHRDIYIGNLKEPVVTAKTAASRVYDYTVTFFPEGGKLLAGHSNKVAFKALGNDGFGTEITGALKDETGKEILTFNSTHLGMGSFIFTPEKEKTYTATVESNGKQKTCVLPESAEGMSISAFQDADSVYLTIKSTRYEPESIRLTGQSQHTICYMSEGLKRGYEQKVSVARDKFPTGIAQFTLWKDNLPQSERLLFIDRNDDLNIGIFPDKEKYGDREKVTLRIKVSDQEGEPVAGSFSLSVTDDKVVSPSVENENIKGSLLLDADIKGYIESPGWYFSSDEPERAEALDNLLCTQGWTRFTWDTLDTLPATYYPEESEFQLTGRLLDKTGSPVRGGEVSLLSNVRNMLPDVSETDEEGRFGFIGFNCPDTAIFILQGRNGRNQQTFFDVRIDTPHVQAPVNIAPLTRAVLPQPAIRTYVEQAVRQKNYEENMWTINLPEIEISTPGKKKEAEQQRIRQGMTGYTIGREQIKDFYSLRDVVRSTPVGIKLERGRPATPPVNRDPLNILVVDGVETDFTEYWNYYEKLPGYMIESMEYVNRIGASMYGARGSGPGGADIHIINIRMRKSQDIAEMFTTASRPSGLKIYKPEGYCVRKDSYIPAYDNPEIKQNPVPDLRTTICWNPVTETNEAGEAEVSFYTADQTTICSYVLEGIGNNQVGFTKYTK
jgi:hypothetical protein